MFMLSGLLKKPMLAVLLLGLLLPLSFSRAEDLAAETEAVFSADGTGGIPLFNEMTKMYAPDNTEQECPVGSVTVNEDNGTAKVCYSAEEEGSVILRFYTDYEGDESEKRLLWESEEISAAAGEAELNIDITSAALPEFFIPEGVFRTASGKEESREFYTYTRDIQFVENATAEDFKEGYYVPVDSAITESAEGPRLMASSGTEYDPQSYVKGYVAYNKDLVLLPSDTAFEEAGTEETSTALFRNVPDALADRTEEELAEIKGFVIRGENFTEDLFLLSDGITLSENGMEVALREPEDLHELYDAVKLSAVSKGGPQKVYVDENGIKGWVIFTPDAHLNWDWGAIWATFSVGIGNMGAFDLSFDHATYEGSAPDLTNKPPVTQLSIKIPSPEEPIAGGFGMEMKSKIYVASNGPAHMAGTYGMGLDFSLSASITSGFSKSFTKRADEVIFTDVTPSSSAVNKDIYVCFGRDSTFSVLGGYFKVKKVLKIGPVLTATVGIDCYGMGHAILEKNETAPAPGVDTIHECLGGAGCIQGQTYAKSDFYFNMTLNLLIKKWKWEPGRTSTNPKRQYFYHSLEHNTSQWSSYPVACPHVLYRFSVKTTENLLTPIPDATISGSGLNLTYSRPKTDEDGIAYDLYRFLPSLQIPFFEVEATDRNGIRIGSGSMSRSELLTHQTIYINRNTAHIREVDIRGLFPSTPDSTTVAGENVSSQGGGNYFWPIVTTSEASGSSWAGTKMSATWDGACPASPTLINAHTGIMRAEFMLDFTEPVKGSEYVQIDPDVKVTILGATGGNPLVVDGTEYRFAITGVEIGDGIDSTGKIHPDSVLFVYADFYIEDEDDRVLVRVLNGLNSCSSQFYTRSTVGMAVGKDVGITDGFERSNSMALVDTMSEKVWSRAEKTRFKREIMDAPEYDRRFNHWEIEVKDGSSSSLKLSPVLSDEGEVSFNTVTFTVPYDPKITEIILTAVYDGETVPEIEEVYLNLSSPVPGEFLSQEKYLQGVLTSEPGRQETPSAVHVRFSNVRTDPVQNIFWYEGGVESEGEIRYNTVYMVEAYVSPEAGYRFKYPLDSGGGTRAYICVNGDTANPILADSFTLVRDDTLNQGKAIARITYYFITPPAPLLGILDPDDLWYPEGTQPEVINAALRLLKAGVIAPDADVTTTTVAWDRVYTEDIPHPGESFLVKGKADLPAELSCADDSLLNTKVRIHIYGADELPPPTADPPGGIYNGDILVALTTVTPDASVEYYVGDEYEYDDTFRTYDELIELRRAAREIKVYTIVAKTVLTDETTGVRRESAEARFYYCLYPAERMFNLDIRGGRSSSRYGGGSNVYLPMEAEVQLHPVSEDDHNLKFIRWQILQGPDPFPWMEGCGSEDAYAFFKMPPEDVIIAGVYEAEDGTEVRLVPQVNIDVKEPEIGDVFLAETDNYTEFLLEKKFGAGTVITIANCETLLWEPGEKVDGAVDYGDSYEFLTAYAIWNEAPVGTEFPENYKYSLIDKTEPVIDPEKKFHRDTVYEDYFSPSVNVNINGIATTDYFVTDDLNILIVTKRYEFPPLTYTLRYDANGGILGEVPKQIVQLDNIATPLTDKEPYRPDGALFLGWSEDPFATEPEYVYSEDPALNPTFCEDTTLYAVWEGDYVVHVRWLDNDNALDTRRPFIVTVNDCDFPVRPENAVEVNGVGCQTIYPVPVPDEEIILPEAKDGTLRFGKADGVENIYAVTIDQGEASATICLTAKRELSAAKEWDIDLEEKDKPNSVTVILQADRKLEGYGDILKKLVDYILSGTGDDYEEVIGELEKELGYSLKGFTPEALAAKLVGLIERKEFTLDNVKETLLNLLRVDTIDSPDKDFYGREILKLSKDNDWKGTFGLTDRFAGTISVDFRGELVAKWEKDPIRYRVVEKSGRAPVENGDDAIFTVPEYIDLAGRRIEEHETIYQVTYDAYGDATTVINLAVEDHFIQKYWLFADDKEKPDPVFAFLLWRYDPEYLEAVKDILGIDIPQFWMPEENPIRGERTSVADLLKKLHLLVPVADKINIPLAMATLTEENGWSGYFRVKKYGNFGLPLEHEAAEFFSAFCQNVLKYFLGIDIPIGFNPLDGYISISLPEIDIPFSPDKLDGIVNLWVGPNDGHSIAGVKVWDDRNDEDGVRPGEITLHIWEDGLRPVADITVTKADAIPIANQFWIWKYKDDSINTDKHIYTVTEDEIEGYTTEFYGLNVVNSREREPFVTVRVIKSWDEVLPVQHEPLELTVKRDGEKYSTVTVSMENDWEVILTGCDKYDTDGRLYRYSVEEPNVPEGYSVSYNVRYSPLLSLWTLSVTDTEQDVPPDKIRLSGNKIWNDMNDKDGIRPLSVTVRLFGDGEEVAVFVLSEMNAWHWTGVFDKYNAAGIPIAYGILEDPIPGYSTTYLAFDVINTHIPLPDPENRSVLVKKIWSGTDDKHPPVPVRVQLLRNGLPVEGKEATLSESNNWRILFDALPILSPEGVPYLYAAEEDPVPEGFAVSYAYSYAPLLDRLTVTVKNKRIGEDDTEIGGRKYWDDHDDKKGLRPDSVIYEIIANAEWEESGGTVTEQRVVDKKTLTAATGWKWYGIYPKKTAEGRGIRYSVQELPVPEYEAIYSEDGLSVTNRLDGSDLTITKTLEGSILEEDLEKAFPFEITLKDAEGKLFEGSKAAVVNGEDTTLSFTKGIATAAIGDGGEIIVKEIPDGWEYAVRELENEEYYTWVIDKENLEKKQADDPSALPDEENTYPTRTRAVKKDMEDSQADFYNRSKYTVRVFWIDMDNADKTRRNFSFTYGGKSHTVDCSKAKEVEGVGRQMLVMPSEENGTIEVIGVDENDLIYFGETDGIADIYEVEVIEGEKEARIILTAKRQFRVKKDWDIDFEKKDHPETVTMILQGDKKPEEDDDILKKLIQYILSGDGEDYEEVIKELEKKLGISLKGFTPEAIAGKLAELIAQGKLSPEDIKDKLLSLLKADTNDSPDKGFYAYQTLKLSDLNEWEDSFEIIDRFTGERGKDDDGYPTVKWDEKQIKYRTVEKGGKAPVEEKDFATFKVPEYTDLAGRVVDAHKTIYQVTYSVYGDLTTVTNTAVEDHLLHKFWLLFGSAEQPKNVLVALLWQYDTEYLEKIKGLIEIEDPQIWLPEINPISGDRISIGDIFEEFGIPFPDIIELPLAIVRLSEKNQWSATFRIKKYGLFGMPLKHVASEFFSAIMRAAIKYIIGIDIPIGINPLKKFISISLPEIKLDFWPIRLDFVFNIWASWDDKSLAGVKYWDDESDAAGYRPDKITLHLYEDGRYIDDIIVTRAENTFLDHLGIWTWKYDNENIDRSKHTYTVTEDPVEHYTTTCSGLTVINRYRPGIRLVVRKYWEEDTPAVHPQLVLVVKRNGVHYKSVTLSKANNWEVVLNNVEETDPNGKLYKYSVEEPNVPKGYAVSYSVSYSGRERTWYLYVTNKKGSNILSGNKYWDDLGDIDGIRPSSVTVHLCANGKEVAVYTLSEANAWHWSGSFAGNDASGKAITYTIWEDPVKDYTTTYSGLDVTNYHRPTLGMSVLVKKEWRGLNSEHPAVPVQVQLFRNGKKYLDPVTLSADNNWQHLYEGLEIRSPEGEQYTYTAQESPVPDGFAVSYSYSYNSARRRLTITVKNSRADRVIGGSKYWDDNDDRLKRRPQSVTFEIIATVEKETENGRSRESKVVDTKILNAGTGWKWSGAYPERDELGRSITYSVQELPVPAGYEAIYSDDRLSVTNKLRGSSLTVTNTVIHGDKTKGFPMLIGLKDETGVPFCGALISIIKGSRSILSFDDGYAYVTLSDGDSATVCGIPDGWEYTVVEKENEEYVTWVIDEENLISPDDPVPNGLLSASGGNSEGRYPEWTRVVKKNLKDSRADFYNDQARELTVYKIWDDGGAYDKRPKTIIVNLFLNGKKYRSAVVTGPVDEGWSYTFTRLPIVTETGEPITYTITEDPVKGYETVISGYTIYNSLRPQKNTFYFYKIWEDDEPDHEDPLFILYHEDGTVCHDTDQPPRRSRTDKTKYIYELDTDDSLHYVREVAIPGWDTSYKNVQGYASVKDRCYNKGTIVNTPYTPPPTGDSSRPIALASLVLLSGAGLYMTVRGKHKKRTY